MAYVYSNVLKVNVLYRKRYFKVRFYTFRYDIRGVKRILPVPMRICHDGRCFKRTGKYEDVVLEDRTVFIEVPESWSVYRFLMWTDGSPVRKRTFTVDRDIDLGAEYVSQV